MLTALDRETLSVLIIENDRELRTLVAEVLADEGYCVLSASNGQRALDLMASQPPGLILLDLRMPVMDGWTFARKLRERGSRIPFVVVSTSDPLANREIAAEAAAYLVKPFSLQELLATVERFVLPA